MTTDTSERGLERLISKELTGHPCDPGTITADRVTERPATWRRLVMWAPEDYDREYCADLI